MQASPVPEPEEAPEPVFPCTVYVRGLDNERQLPRARIYAERQVFSGFPFRLLVPCA